MHLELHGQVYDNFVLSWCIVGLNESLLGEDYLCNDTYSPTCGDEIEDDTCPAACNGRPSAVDVSMSTLSGDV